MGMPMHTSISAEILAFRGDFKKTHENGLNFIPKHPELTRFSIFMIENCQLICQNQPADRRRNRVFRRR